MARKPRSSIPKNAKEVVRRVTKQGFQFIECIVDGRVVGERTRNKDGVLEQEFSIKDGEMHGYAFAWYENGQLMSQTRYVNGFEHGIAKQWTWDGQLLGTYEMRHGTGVDLWRDNLTGTLAEEHHCKDGMKEGFARWWNEDQKTVHTEWHFKGYEYHGIQREWNLKGRLRRGYPQYNIGGKKVTKRQYVKACKSDPTLPKFREKDNAPRRKLPAEYVRVPIKAPRCSNCGDYVPCSEDGVCPECDHAK